MNRSSCVLPLAVCGLAIASWTPLAASQPTSKTSPTTTERAPTRNPVQDSALRERSIDLLIEFTSDADPRVRANALEALVRVPKRLEAQAAAALKDPSPAVRSVAAMAVGRAGIKSLAASLRALQNDPSEYVQAAAIMGLGKLGQSPDPSPLAGWLLGSSSVKLRSHAAFVLGELGNPSAAALLRDALRQGAPRGQEAEWQLFKLQVAEARAKLGETSQLEVIQAALYPGSPDGFEAAMLATQILGQLKDRAAEGTLIPLIEGSKATGPSQAPTELRLTAGHALARLGHKAGAADLAREFAKDESPVIRAQVAAILADAGTVQDLPGLEQWMTKSSEPQVRLAAASALVSIIDRTSSGR